MTGIEYFIVSNFKELASKMELLPKKKVKDNCKICNGDLYLDGEVTKRIGLIENDRVVGWMCPMCKSQFTESGGIVKIFSDCEDEGEA
tara:strand:+ start:1217 stop:1480 length:264 start_codon:yes stop_codon:yes gene_type:complete